MKRSTITSALILASLALAMYPGELRAQLGMAPDSSTTLHAILDSTVRRNWNVLPAMAAAVIVDGTVLAVDAVGLRNFDDSTLVATEDRWHLGPCTEAMTATMIARLVEAGNMKWTTTIGEVFPELVKKMRKAYRGVTMEMLLAHRGGLPAQWSTTEISFEQVYKLPGDERAQREAYVAMMLRAKPDASPGTKFIHSEAGYAIAGAMAERITGKPFDTLMAETIFRPLGITHYGFGQAHSPGKIDQPWSHWLAPHTIPGPVEGWITGLPPALTPAGRITMSIKDWATFVIAHLDGEAHGGILRPETFKRLHVPLGGNYAAGWSVVPRPWAGGMALIYAGSTSPDFAVVWAAPARHFAVLVAANMAQPGTVAACNKAAGAILQAYLLTK